VFHVLHWLDWLVIALYFVVVLLVGFLASRRIKNTGDYFLGGRSFNKWLVMGQAFGVGTHAEMPVSLAGAVYQNGYSAIWYQWKNLFITPFYWILAPIFRRFRRNMRISCGGRRSAPQTARSPPRSSTGLAR